MSDRLVISICPFCSSKEKRWANRGYSPPAVVNKGHFIRKKNIICEIKPKEAKHTQTRDTDFLVYANIIANTSTAHDYFISSL